MSEHDNWFPRLRKDLAAAFACRRGLVQSPTPRRTRFPTVVTCVLAIMLGATTPALAAGSSDPTSVVVDVLVARPISFAVTTVGSALFIISLPFAAASRSTHETAETLVVGPARDLFTRPVGDFDGFLDY